MATQGEVVSGAVSRSNPQDHQLTTVARISAELRKIGAEPLKRKQLPNGRQQYWTTLKDGRVIASYRPEGVCDKAGVTIRREALASKPKDAVNALEAAGITGFSASAIHRAIRAGEIDFWIPPGCTDRNFHVSRVGIERWAAERRALGGQYAPRVRRAATGSLPRVRRPNPAADSPANPRQLNIDVTDDTRARLDQCLKRLAGTMFEMPRSVFVERAINRAIDEIDGLPFSR